MPTTLLSTRKKLNIGTWNVRTMYKAGKTAQVAAEIRRFNLALLGLCETRWTQSGRLRLTTGEIILYSGHEEDDAPHSEGVALLLGKEAQRALIGWEARGPRCITASFRTKKAGFRQDRSCTDQIATLRIIMEQSIEWNSSLYINFFDYEKAFDSVDRETLWKVLRHYGVPKKLVNMIKNSYEGMSCRVIHEGQLTKNFEVRTGVRQGCLLSPFLFILVIDWVMKTATKEKRNGIQWTMLTQLDDLDFADDLALLSHSHRQMQDKTTELALISERVGLKINKTKTKILRTNATWEHQSCLRERHWKRSNISDI